MSADGDYAVTTTFVHIVAQWELHALLIRTAILDFYARWEIFADSQEVTVMTELAREQ